MNQHQSPQPAGLGLRILAGVYDLLPIIGLWFGVGMIGVALNGGEALGGSWRIVLMAAVLAATMGYIAVSLQRGGQTLGMRAWRLRLVDARGAPPGRAEAWKRAAWSLLQVMPLGIGLLPAVFDAQRRTLADRICATRVLRLPRAAC